MDRLANIISGITFIGIAIAGTLWTFTGRGIFKDISSPFGIAILVLGTALYAILITSALGLGIFFFYRALKETL